MSARRVKFGDDVIASLPCACNISEGGRGAELSVSLDSVRQVFSNNAYS